jgi:uncharacterized membrane protein (UPF0127 family)
VTWFLLSALACSSHKLPTHTVEIDGQSMLVEVAATPELRADGLMFRDTLPADEGMIFVYPDSAPRAFWMKNTRIPLSIAYVDDDGKIVRIADMVPLSTDRVPSVYPIRYAIEVNKGWFAEHDVVVGDMVSALPQVEAK